jgi:A/G-specific adenine glycosylase
MNITSLLQDWYHLNKRDLPWRKTISPYHIWLSEIILQQTRVNQGLGYYLKFTQRFPELGDLAAASLDEVLKLWQGLGYYTRARNLHFTAQYIFQELGGIFPRTSRELQNLRGIGKYTAAAIASIAYKEPVALVDGNVFRVLSRLFGEATPIDSTRGMKVFGNLADQILDRKRPDIHNQALMELGALVCLPGIPVCGECPLSAMCQAYNRGITDSLPVRQERKKTRDRYFNYFYVKDGGTTWLSSRSSRDIWHSLYEFPLIETVTPVGFPELTRLPDWHGLFGNRTFTRQGAVEFFRHKLTHQTIHCSFYKLVLQDNVSEPEPFYIRVKLEEVHQYPVPRVIDKYMSRMNQEGL